MNRIKHSALILLFCFFVLEGLAQEVDMKSIYADVEFKMEQIIEPKFKRTEYLITDFGAKGDGQFKNTEAFHKAIAKAFSQGGGTVVVPEGIWYTGPITLKSNINLHLKQGALILFSDQFDDYPLVETSYEGLKSARSTSPINALGAKNIAITGKGIIDGNGGAWRPVKKSKMTQHQWNALISSGGVLSDNKSVWYPDEAALKGSKSDLNDWTIEQLQTVRSFLRPVMVSLVDCENILLDGPTFQNSPAWNIHPLMSKNIIVRNLTVRNPWYAQNGDGLDLESCENVLVYNNTFDVGDDAICIKSGKNEDGRKRNMPTKNVIIKNNTVYHGHGGFVVGSEMSGGVSKIHISHCNFIGTDTGLRFKSTRGRGGVVEQIYISHIYMNEIKTDAIRFNLYYGGQAPDLSNDLAENKEDSDIPEVTIETPSFKDIYISDITSVKAHKSGFFMGLPEMNIQNVSIKNSQFHGEEGFTLIDSDQVHFNNVKIEATEAPMQLHNTKNLVLEQLHFLSKESTNIQISGTKTKNISLKYSGAAQNYQIKSGVESSEITVK